MRYADVVRATLGGVLLLRPAVAPRVVGEPPSRATEIVTRVLAARLLVQAAAGAVAMRRGAAVRGEVARADVAVEALHGASMIGLAVVLPRRRRLALAGAAVAAACAVADHLAADRSAAARRARLLARAA